MGLSDIDARRAARRMQARLKGQPRATSARFDRRGARIVVGLSNGLDLGVPVELAQGPCRRQGRRSGRHRDQSDRTGSALAAPGC